MLIPPRRDLVAGFALTFALLAVHVVTAPPARPEPQPVSQYAPPVDAPITDPFRAPATPYGPGHRGIEYGTPPGTTVGAPAAGRVVFAGLVAGTRYVTIGHPDGLRTTVGPLAAIAVGVGDAVAAGQPVGTTLGALLFTVRRGETYIDPASLVGTGPPQVHLIPERAPSSPRSHTRSPGDPGAVAWLTGPERAAVLVSQALRSVAAALM